MLRASLVVIARSPSIVKNYMNFEKFTNSFQTKKG